MPLCCETWAQISMMMVDYCSACSAPSSIGEDEIIKAGMDYQSKFIAPNGNDLDVSDIDFMAGIRWAISRLSERKIVLPSEEWLRDNKNTKSMSEAYAVGKLYGIDLILSEIKRLNGINKPQNEGE